MLVSDTPDCRPLYLEPFLGLESKFLGLTWDKKLSWKPHITKLKEKCLRTLNILKSITSQSWGSDQLMTIRIFRSITRSILDYGAIV